ncbi:kinase-regulated stress-responsive transcription factor SKN7 [Nakaseomyces bracarensis]|uniref:kinase-regulated stress-responsive transcription factor SKN7 n=1 Tax=Nakaseomyces bracarensis TaxID=273131 RepID=UPI0038729255
MNYQVPGIMNENMMLSEQPRDDSRAQDSKNNNGKPASNDFVRKLFSILESNQYPTIVRWSESGDSFMVLDTGKFTTQILPNHFKHSNFASFVRQLNKYDFHKIKRSNEEKQKTVFGEQSWEFENPNFRIHYEEGLDLIKRKTPAQKKVMLDESGAPIGRSADVQNESKLKSALLSNTVRKDIFNNLRKRVDKLQREMHDVSMENYNMKSEYQRLSSKYDTLLSSLITFKTINENLINNFNILCNALSSKGVDIPQSVYENLNINMPIPSANSPLNISPSPSLALPLKSTTMSPSLPSMKSLQRTPSLAPKIGGSNQLDMSQGQLDSSNQNTESPEISGISANSSKAQADQNVILRKGFHVLLVEDDSVSIELCSKFLRKDGCTVQVVTDGLSAISNLEKFRYDLVLMDIVMPNLDGATATSIVRSFDNQTPIIAMTGNIEDQDLITYLQHGMNDILAKPFTRNDLHSILVRHLKDRVPLCDQNRGQHIKTESPNIPPSQQMLNIAQQNDNTTSPLPQSLPPIQPSNQQSPLFSGRASNITPLVPLNQALSPQLPIDSISSNGPSLGPTPTMDGQPALKKQHT